MRFAYKLFFLDIGGAAEPKVGYLRTELCYQHAVDVNRLLV